MAGHDQKTKTSNLVHDLFKWSEDNNLLRILPEMSPFIFYSDFKRFIIMRYGADGHTIRSYRDRLLVFKFIKVDYAERVFFTFQGNPNYQPSLDLKSTIDLTRFLKGED